jgi:hypothetical protein
MREPQVCLADVDYAASATTRENPASRCALKPQHHTDCYPLGRHRHLNFYARQGWHPFPLCRESMHGQHLRGDRHLCSFFAVVLQSAGGWVFPIATGTCSAMSFGV